MEVLALLAKHELRATLEQILPSVDLGPTRRTLIPAWAVEELVAAPDRLSG